MSATVGPAILCALDSPWESVTMADVTGKSSVRSIQTPHRLSAGRGSLPFA